MEKTLIYDNPLCSQENIAAFRLEGNASISFPNNRMRMESIPDLEQTGNANFVLWTDQNFPPDIQVEWDFWPIREPGLCILFFSAAGRGGEDLFDPSLPPRSGDYEQYHHGGINAYHVSYFRRRWEDEREFHTCNLRKSYGFHLVCQGADPIPSVEDAKPPYHMELQKFKNEISFSANGLSLFRWLDHEKTAPLGGGKIGFRQMAPLCAEYANLKVYSLQSSNH